VGFGEFGGSVWIEMNENGRPRITITPSDALAKVSQAGISARTFTISWLGQTTSESPPNWVSRILIVKSTITIGDVYRIGLPDGRSAYSQVLHFHQDYGYLVRVLNLISNEYVSVPELTHVCNLFPPVFVNLVGGIKGGLWKKVGNMPLSDCTFPTFRSSVATTHGEHNNWWLWDGGERRFIGKLPEELRSLEVELIWSHEILAERITTGDNHWSKVI
jgi:hypothetical protein